MHKRFCFVDRLWFPMWYMCGREINVSRTWGKKMQIATSNDSHMAETSYIGTRKCIRGATHYLKLNTPRLLHYRNSLCGPSELVCELTRFDACTLGIHTKNAFQIEKIERYAYEKRKRKNKERKKKQKAKESTEILREKRRAFVKWHFWKTDPKVQQGQKNNDTHARNTIVLCRKRQTGMGNSDDDDVDGSNFW